MSTLSTLLRRTGAALALAAASLASHAAPTTQLGILIDASGSIGTTNFNTMRSGYAAALRLWRMPGISIPYLGPNALGAEFIDLVADVCSSPAPVSLSLQ